MHGLNLTPRLVLTLSLVIASLPQGFVRAEIVKVTLPGDFADFAFHPETGDIAAISTEEAQAMLFREGRDLSKPAEKLRIGTSPVSITYKRFGAEQYYAVVCSQDTNLYLIDSKTFKITKKIDLAQIGVSSVVGSQNSADPYLYYCYGSGHGCTMGAVNLRDFTKHDNVLDRTMDCAVDATGQYIYRRGPMSPSGFESFIRTSEFSSSKPTLIAWYHEHRQTALYCPDPYGHFTAAGNTIYSNTLEKAEAATNVSIRCFFKTIPVVIGAVDSPPRGTRGPRTGVAVDSELRCVSYNSFASIGSVVKLPIGELKTDGTLPRGIPNQADFKKLTKRQRFFADDARKRLVVPIRNELFYVPLSEFQISDEPFLYAKFDKTGPLQVGQAHKLTLISVDPGLKVDFEDVPVGATATGATLNWNPVAEQVGTVVVIANLSRDQFQKALKFEFEVTLPFLSLPFTPGGLAIGDFGKTAVIWEDPSTVDLGRPQPGSGPGRIAAIELPSGKIIAERKVREGITSVVVVDSSIALQREALDSNVEILTLADLELKKEITNQTAFQNLQVFGRYLILQTNSGYDVYDGTKLGKVTSFSAVFDRSWIGQNVNARHGVTEEGLFANGVLYDEDLKPKLFLVGGEMPEISGTKEETRQKIAMRLLGIAKRQTNRQIPGMSDTIPVKVAGKHVPGKNVEISLNRRIQQLASTGPRPSQRTQLDFAFAASGNVDANQLICRRIIPNPIGGPRKPETGLLEIYDDQAYALCADKLYRWTIPRANRDAETSVPQLRIKPMQSTLMIERTGETELRHSAYGGKSPIRYSLLSNYDDAARIDAKTGVVTVDGPRIRQVIRDRVMQAVFSAGYQSLDQVQSPTSAGGRRFEQLIGRKPLGAPIALPISIEVSDGEQTDHLQYCVIAELTGDELQPKPKPATTDPPATDAKIPKPGLATSNTMDNTRITKGNPAKPEALDQSEIARRLDAVEEKLEKLTETLNALLKEKREKDGVTPK